MMKITEKQLKKLIAEARIGSVGIGFAGWGPNKTPDFSKSFGSEGSYASDLLKSKIRNSIRNIVREEVETLSYDEETISEEQAESAALAVDRPEEIQTVPDAWAGGPNLTHSIDHSDAVDSDPVTRGQEALKITESQLRRIIKEEKARLLTEVSAGGSGNKYYGSHPSSYRPGESVLTDIAAMVDDSLKNYVGEVDLDFSDEPLTYKDIVDFVARMLHEQR